MGVEGRSESEIIAAQTKYRTKENIENRNR
jgi:hypothetical protein